MAKSPKTILLYSPLQFGPGELAKPDGSLSLAYLAGSLRDHGYECKILDCSVGDSNHSLQDTFYKSTPLSSGLLQVGLSTDEILSSVAAYDVVGISSIFTTQTTPVLNTIRAIKKEFPNKLIISGGVNARSLRERFFQAGVDIICLSEAESTIVDIIRWLEGRILGLSEISGIATRDGTMAGDSFNANLDKLPLPAWDMLPLQKYWDISRPHGGHFQSGQTIRYASIQTTRGCPFKCTYCHISNERVGSDSGPIGAFRRKSIDRVICEFERLKSFGVEYVFIEDDSLLADKKRAYEIFELVKKFGFHLLDVNGINVCHFQKNESGTLVVDTECIDRMKDAGFDFIVLPFESANQRILDKYATGKWNSNRVDTKSLIRAFERAKIPVSGNYMVGFPDETLPEIYNTIEMAKRNMQEGLNHVLFFAVVPFPGTVMYDEAIRSGQLDKDFNPDDMRWTKSVLKDLCVSPDVLQAMCQTAWLTLNRADYIQHKTQMTV